MAAAAVAHTALPPVRAAAAAVGAVVLPAPVLPIPVALRVDGQVPVERAANVNDAMAGDHTLFTSGRNIERLWEVSEPLLRDPPAVKPYAQGSWGPTEVGRLIAPNSWRLPFARRWRE